MPFQKGHPDYVSKEGRKRMAEAVKKRWQDPEYKERISKKIRGDKNPAKRPEVRKKIREAKSGINILEETKQKIRMSHLGKKLTEEHKRKIGESEKGKKHWNWKGGVTSLKKRIREDYKYRQWRLDVFKRDNWTCQNCHKRGGLDLEAHHTKEFIKLIKENDIKTIEDAIKCKELWNINNGTTLCINCHNVTKNGREK